MELLTNLEICFGCNGEIQAALILPFRLLVYMKFHLLFINSESIATY
jgi:hypothetical protein